MKVTHFGDSGQAGSAFAGDEAAASVIYASPPENVNTVTATTVF